MITLSLGVDSHLNGSLELPANGNESLNDSLIIECRKCLLRINLDKEGLPESELYFMTHDRVVHPGPCPSRHPLAIIERRIEPGSSDS